MLLELKNSHLEDWNCWWCEIIVYWYSRKDSISQQTEIWTGINVMCHTYVKVWYILILCDFLGFYKINFSTVQRIVFQPSELALTLLPLYLESAHKTELNWGCFILHTLMKCMISFFFGMWWMLSYAFTHAFTLMYTHTSLSFWSLQHGTKYILFPSPSPWCGSLNLNLT